MLEPPIFTRRADALLSPEDRADLIATLAADPRTGAIMPGLGGIRKMRFAPAGQGKSGAFRVIFQQRKVIVRLVEALKAAARNARQNHRGADA